MHGASLLFSDLDANGERVRAALPATVGYKMNYSKQEWKSAQEEARIKFALESGVHDLIGESGE